MEEEATGMEPTTLGGSSKYAVNYNIPADFAEVLRKLTREILRLSLIHISEPTRPY